MGWAGTMVNRGFISTSGRRIVRGANRGLDFYDEARYLTYDNSVYGDHLW